jgi:hypothetical protein
MHVLDGMPSKSVYNRLHTKRKCIHYCRMHAKQICIYSTACQAKKHILDCIPSKNAYIRLPSKNAYIRLHTKQKCTGRHALRHRQKIWFIFVVAVENSVKFFFLQSGRYAYTISTMTDKSCLILSLAEIRRQCAPDGNLKYPRI